MNTLTLPTFSSAELAQMRRDAKRISKQERLTHSEALDYLAAKHGYANWSLLSKRSATNAAPEATAPVNATTRLVQVLEHALFLRTIGLLPSALDDWLSVMLSSTAELDKVPLPSPFPKISALHAVRHFEDTLSFAYALEYSHLEVLKLDVDENFWGYEFEQSMGTFMFYVCEWGGLELEQDSPYILKATPEEICEHNLLAIKKRIKKISSAPTATKKAGSASAKSDYKIFEIKSMTDHGEALDLMVVAKDEKEAAGVWRMHHTHLGETDEPEEIQVVTGVVPKVRKVGVIKGFDPVTGSVLR
jgi:hypothetical protein